MKEGLLTQAFFRIFRYQKKGYGDIRIRSIRSLPL